MKNKGYKKYSELPDAAQKAFRWKVMRLLEEKMPRKLTMFCGMAGIMLLTSPIPMMNSDGSNLNELLQDPKTLMNASVWGISLSNLFKSLFSSVAQHTDMDILQELSILFEENDMDWGDASNTMLQVMEHVCLEVINGLR